MADRAKNIMPFLVGLLLLFGAPASVLSYDVSEKLSLEGMLTGVYQYGSFDMAGLDDAGRGAVVFDMGMNFHPTEKDEFQVTLSFAAGNGLNRLSPFVLAPYADDLEDDLKNVNGRNRDYLLEAWYKRTLMLSESASLSVTGGIIDATAYIDDNAFANDETAQFMNDIFVNNTLANLPSYDLGGVVDLAVENFSLRGVAMNSRNDAERNYGYYAIQLGYAPATPFGKGTYRLYGFTTNKQFDGWKSDAKERLNGFGISADQEVSKTVGVFMRLGWQDDDAAIVHRALYSGGVNLSGTMWGRSDDVAGIGYAYLKGATKGEIDSTNALEAYVKVKLNDFTDVTVDFQYLKDAMRDDEDRDGVIYGIRMNAYF